MSRLASEWAEKTFKLPRKILPNVERSLANGYLFLVILKQCGCVSDDDFDAANDGTTPDVVMKNFTILAKSLKEMDLSIKKSQVVSIISEEPGGASDLIMKIKRGYESGGKAPRPSTPPYKAATKTVRPKKDGPFKRPSVLKDERNADERLYDYEIKNKSLSEFRDMHPDAQVAEHMLFRYETDVQIEQAIEEDVRTKEENKKISFQKRQQEEKEIMRRTRDIAADGVKKWQKSKLPEKNRKIRDTQFELAKTTRKEYKKARADHDHRLEQEKGIDAFEINLKRSGIGGDDEGGQLSTTYEEAGSFLQRMVETASKVAPTNEEISDILNGVKNRTQENKTARYEKSRRKRRMALEQAAASTGMTSMLEEDDSEDEVDKLATQVLELEKKKKEKEEKDAELKVTCNLKLAEKKEQGEDYLRIYFEQQRMLSFDQTDRAGELAAATKAIQERAIYSRKKHEALCLSIVKSMISDILDDDSTAQEEGLVSLKDCNDPVSSILNACNATIQDPMNDKANGTTNLNIPQIISEERWPSVLFAAKNAGRWTRGANKVNTFTDSMLKGLNRVLEAVAKGISEESAAPVKLQTHEFSSNKENANRVILVTGKGHTISRSDWNTVITGLGGEDKVQVWDQVAALDCAYKFASCFAGKKPSVDFSTLYTACLDQETCPDELASTAVTAEAVDVVTATYEIAKGIESFQPVIDAYKALIIDGEVEIEESEAADPSEVEGEEVDEEAKEAARLAAIEAKKETIKEEKKAACKAALEAFTPTFTDINLASLVGQTAWLRQWVIDQCIAVEQLKIPVASTVLISRNWGRVTDDPLLCRVIDWFLRGGTTSNIPEDDTILTEALGGGGGKKKKGAAEGPEQTAIHAVLVLTGKEEEGATAPILPPDAVMASSGLAAGAAMVYESRKKITPVTAAEVEIRNESDNVGETDDLKASFESEAALLNVPLFDATVHNTLSLVESMAAVYICLNEKEVDTNISTAAEDQEGEKTEEVPTENAPTPTTEGLGLEAPSSSAPTVTPTENMMNIIASRRGNWDPDVLMGWLHACGVNAIAPDSAMECLKNLQKSRSIELKILGGVVYAADICVEEIVEAVESMKVELTRRLKAVDPRWERTCKEFTTILGTPGEAKRVDMDDLIVRLGDIIDERHILWMKLSEELDIAANKLLMKTFARLDECNNTALNTVLSTLDKRAEVGTILCDTLQQAGYSSLPWSSTFTTTAVTATDDMVDIPAVDIHSSSSSPLAAIVGNELRAEAVTVASAFAKASQNAKKILESRVTALSDWCEQRCRKRVEYEHSVLNRWSKELSRSLFENYDRDANSREEPQVSLINKYFFGVSDDAAQDGIPFLKGRGRCELGDLVLEPIQILYVMRDLVEVENAKSNGAALVQTARALVDKSILLPPAWRNPQRLNALSSRIVLPTPCNNDDNNYNSNGILSNNEDGDTNSKEDENKKSFAMFCRRLVMYLLMGVYKTLPTVEYLRRIHTVCSKSPVTVQEFTRKLNQDARLNVGWLHDVSNSNAKPPSKESITEQFAALEAIACTCVTDYNTGSSATIDVDLMVLTLTGLPQSPAVNLFDEALIGLSGSAMTPGVCKYLSLITGLRKEGTLTETKIDAGAENSGIGEQDAVANEVNVNTQMQVRNNDITPTDEWLLLRAVDRLVLNPAQLAMSLTVTDTPTTTSSFRNNHSNEETVMGVSTSKGTVGIVHSPPKIVLSDWIANGNPNKGYLQAKFSTYDTTILEK